MKVKNQKNFIYKYNNIYTMKIYVYKLLYIKDDLNKHFLEKDILGLYIPLRRKINK